MSNTSPFIEAFEVALEDARKARWQQVQNDAYAGILDAEKAAQARHNLQAHDVYAGEVKNVLALAAGIDGATDFRALSELLFDALTVKEETFRAEATGYAVEAIDPKLPGSEQRLATEAAMHAFLQAEAWFAFKLTVKGVEVGLIIGSK